MCVCVHVHVCKCVCVCVLLLATAVCDRLTAPQASDGPVQLEARLAGWYDATVDYLPRCCDLFGDHLPMLLYATVVGRPVLVVRPSALLLWLRPCPCSY